MSRNDKGIVIENAEDKEDNAKASAPLSATENKESADVVRFWSTHEKYSVAVAPGKNASFFKHFLTLESGDPSVKIIRSLKSSNIKEVLEVPFAKDDELARFNKFLQGVVYAGERMMVSKRGLVALKALFNPKDGVDMGVEPDILIMQALKKKSFKEGI